MTQHQGIFGFYWKMVLRPHFWESMAVFVLMFGSGFMDMLTVGLVVPLLDSITNSRTEINGLLAAGIHKVWGLFHVNPDKNLVVFTLLALVMAAFVIRSVLFLFNQYGIAFIAHKIRRQLKFMLMERYLNARYEWLTHRDRGVLLKDVTTPPDFVYSNIMNFAFLLTALINVALLIMVMVYMSWQMTLVMGVLAVGGVFGWKNFSERRADEAGRVAYGLERRQSKLEVDMIDGLKVIKSHTLQSSMLEQYKSVLLAMLKPELKLVLLRSWPACIYEALGAFVVLALGSLVFLRPSLGLSFSVFGAFILAMRRVAPAVAGINSAFVELGRSRKGIEIIDEIMNTMPLESSGEKMLKEKVRELSLEDVSFSYSSNPGREVLSGAGIQFKMGTVTVIAGSTGSGKSTLVNLIMRLYEPKSGRVSVNGIPLHEVNLSDWRRRIGYVSQDIFLFNTTIRENITLWKRNLTDAEVQAAAQLAQIHSFIQSLPEGYDTVVGDRGLRLSGGQCQRLAIARALIHQPEILIFDEATSALDNVTEKAVYDAMDRLRPGSVIIVVAHRLSTVQDADQIVVLEGGKVAETGSYDELMRARQVFWKLVSSKEPSPLA